MVEAAESEGDSEEDSEDSDSVSNNTFDATLPAVQIALEFYCEHSAKTVIHPRHDTRVHRVRIIQRHGFVQSAL